MSSALAAIQNAPAASRMLLLDLGNTRLKFAFGDAVSQMQALPYDQQAPDFSSLVSACRLRSIEAIWLCSVVPTVADALTASLVHAGLPKPQQALATSELGRLKNAYAEPWRLGADRFMALLACAEQTPAQATLVAIVGTALTIDLLDADGQHHGGLIAPGPSLMRQSLQRGAAQLNVASERAFAFPEFASNTIDAINSGCARACAGLIVAQWHQAVKMLQTDVVLRLSGGGAPALMDLLPNHTALSPSLILQGLQQFAALRPVR